MDKFAQERGILNTLREKINMPGSYLEGFFKPELDRVMRELKLRDDNIRAILTGKKIGSSDVDTDGRAAKDTLKEAQKNFNRREYMLGVADLGRFHKKMLDVKKQIDIFKVDINKIHNKFLFEGVDDDRITELREHMRTAAEVADDDLVKVAGIMDFFVNIGTKRGRGLAAWEKKYPKETKDLRDDGLRLLSDARRLFEDTMSSLKAMATARAIRRPDDYADAAEKIKLSFDKFENGPKGFRAYYNGPITKWLAIKDEIEAKESKLTEQETAKTAPPSATTTPATGATPGSAVTPQGPPAGVPLGVGSPPFAPPASTPPSQPIPQPGTWATVPVPAAQTQQPIPEPPATEKELEPAGSKAQGAHRRFYESLESMGKEEPIVIAKYISKYATAIQTSDPETAIKLFQVARRVRG